MKKIKKIGVIILLIVLLMGIFNINPIIATTTGIEDAAISEAMGKFKREITKKVEIEGAYCTHIETTKRCVSSYKKGNGTEKVYELKYGYSVTIKYIERFSDRSALHQAKYYSGTITRYNTEYIENGKKGDSNNYDTPYRDETDWNDYQNNQSNQNNINNEPIKQTISATEISKSIKEGGAYFFNVKFDNTIVVEQAPKLKIKIGDKIRELAYNSQTKNSITYKTIISEKDLIGKNLELESLSGGKIKSDKENTVITMDYNSKLNKKTLGKVENFIIVDKGKRGDINKDGRIDNLDVELILNSKDKKLADVNGDGKIDNNDKQDLEKAIEKLDLLYINYIIKGKERGDVNNDGVINYRDAEQLAKQIANNSSYANVEADVNGDGKVTAMDCADIMKAIRKNSAMYLHHIKVTGDTIGDINNDGVINSLDVFEIAKLKENDLKGDINKDGKVDIRDQASLISMLVAEDTSKLNYIDVYIGSRGDVNKDGRIDYTDADLIAKYLANKHVNKDSMEIDIEIADVNEDGKISAMDVAFIAEAISTNDTQNEKRLKLLSYSSGIDVGINGKGDVNGDGRMDYIDVKLLSQYIANKSLNKDTENINSSIEVADINGDGKISAIDCSEMLKLLNQNKNGQDEAMSEDSFLKEIEFEYIMGDVNLDGKIDSADVSVLNKYLVNEKLYPLSDLQKKNADCNKDGEINSKDSIYIINKVIRSCRFLINLGKK